MGLLQTSIAEIVQWKWEGAKISSVDPAGQCWPGTGQRCPTGFFQVIPDVSLSFSLKSRQRCRANHASFLPIPWDGILGVDFGEGQGGALAIRPLRHGFASLE